MTLLAILAFIGALFTLILGIILFAYVSSMSAVVATPLMRLLIQLIPALGADEQDMAKQLTAGGAVFILIAAICAAECYGLWRIRNWGRILTVVVAALGVLRSAAVIYTANGNLILQLIVIAVDIWIISYLLKANVKKAFNA